MSASAPITVRWRVGRYTVEMSAARPAAGEALTLLCEWSPRLPVVLTRQMLREYERGKAKALGEIIATLAAEAHRQGLTVQPDPLAETQPNTAGVH